MRDYFHRIADELTRLLRGDEVYLAGFSAEESDFVRLNGNRVRQAGSVTQRALGLEWIRGRRRAQTSLALTGDLELDRGRLVAEVERLRDVLGQVQDDPFLLYATEPRSSEHPGESRLPEAAEALASIHKACEGRDAVGLYAAGGSFSGFANSLGQRNWHQSHSYNFDWSFYHAGDKAVKASYAGLDWSPAELERRVELAVEQLSVLARPSRSIEPGRYRVYLAPAALDDIFGMLSWGGFGLRAHRTRTTPLLRMIQQGASLHPGISVTENTRDGTAPDFQGEGFIRPPHVELIRAGRYAGTLVSPRSAVEYQVATNGASALEAPLSLDVAPGDLERDAVLRELGTGIYVGNLHYLNYSDRNACRTTGMTRFATFWVEGGAIQSPLEVMRFDETLYRMLGENLAGLTREREMVLDPMTYGRRSSRSARLPGALIDDFTFTL